MELEITVSSCRYFKHWRKTAKGKTPYEYWERIACIERDMAK